MEELFQSKCKNCGADFVETDAVNGVIKCRYCHSAFTLPKEGADPAALSFLRQGDHDLDTGKFEDAFTAYHKAAQLDPSEPEAYFGMALAEFKVQYLKDTANNCLQPICHEISDKVFSQNKNYKRALELATNSQRIEYERKGMDIDTIGEEFYKQQQAGIDYDCFICVKVTDDETKTRTADYKYADDIYFELKGKGYKPFFSERELRGVAGADYEARILYALYSAECMLVVCSNEEYLRTPWVRNEYTRFLKLVNDEEKESDSITIVFNGKPIEKLAGKNGKIQGIDFGSFKAIEEITAFVEKHSPEGKARLEREKERQRELEAERERKLQEIQREFEEKLKNVNVGAASETVSTLLTCAEQELAAGEFAAASDYFKQVRNRDPVNDLAWWGFFLVEFGVKHEKELLQVMDCALEKKIEASRNFKMANQYLTEKNKERVNAFIAKMRAPSLWWERFLKEMSVSNEMQLCGSNISSAIINKVKNSENYKNATKYADNEYRARIEKFNERLESPESNWTLFLQDCKARKETDILEDISADRLQVIESNACFNNARQRATGELRNRIDAFCDTLHSSEIWWSLFLREFRVSSEGKLLEDFDTNLRQKLAQSKNYVNAKRFSDGDAAYSGRISDFEKRIEEQEKAYSDGRAVWNKISAEYEKGGRRGGKTDTETDYLDEQPEYKQALELARKSHVQSFIKQIEDKGRAQRRKESSRVGAVLLEIRKAKRSKAKLISCNIAVGVLCIVFTLLELISPFLGVTVSGNGFGAKLFSALSWANMSLGIKLALLLVILNGVGMQVMLAVKQIKNYKRDRTRYSGTFGRVSTLIMQLLYFVLVVAAQYSFFILKPVSFGEYLGVAQYGTLIVVALAMCAIWVRYRFWQIILAFILAGAYVSFYIIFYACFPLFELSAWMELVPLIFIGVPLLIYIAVVRAYPFLTNIILFIVAMVLLASVLLIILYLSTQYSYAPYIGTITFEYYLGGVLQIVGYLIGGVIALGVLIGIITAIVHKFRY